jgi:hypothetical protein
MKKYGEVVTPYTENMIKKWESTKNPTTRETILVNYSDMYAKAIRDMILDGKLNELDIIPYIQKYGDKYFSDRK